MKRLKTIFACMLMAFLSIGQMWGGVSGTYNLVTNASSLAANDVVILVNNANDKALQGLSSTSTVYGTLADVSASNGVITLSNANVEELTIEAGYNNSGLSFKGTTNISGYLNWTSGNSLTANANKSANTSWSVSISDGVATISNNNTTNRQIRYNSSSPRFATYAPNNQSVYTGTAVRLYKKSQSSSDKPTISAGPVSAKYGVGATATALSVSATVSEGGGTLHYAWKSNTTNSVEGASDAANATDASTYTPSTTSAGNMYYFCVVSDDNGSATSSIAEVKVMTPLTTMDEIFAAATTAGGTETDVAITFNNWQISGVKNSNAFLTDGTKGAVIYGSSGSGFAEKNVLSGIVACKVQLFKQFAEITSLTATTTGLTVNEGSELTPVVKTIDQLSAVNTGALVTIQNLTYNGTNLSDGTNTIITYNTFYSASLTSGKKYNITGVFQYYNGTKQILPRKAADVQLVQEKTLTSITLSGTYPTTFEQDDDFSHTGMVVTAHYNDESTETVTTSATFTGYAMSETGEQTVTVHYSENTTEVTTTYTITVSAPAPTGDWESFEGALTDLVAGDYLIYDDGYESSLMKAEIISGKGRLAYEVLAPDANGIISEPSRYAVWTLAKSGDYWTIYNAKAGKYAAATGASGKAQLLASDEEGKILWSIDEDLNISSKYNAEQEPAVNALLRHNFTTTGQNAGNYGFACYGSSTGAQPVFYKRAVASYYITETLTGCSAADGNATKVPQALTEDVVLKYNLAIGYVWPDAITVEVGGVALDADNADYLWDTSVSPAELTIDKTLIDGDIVVTIVAQLRELDNITVKEAPTKTAYFVGDFFNPAGLEIQLNYTAGDPETVVYNDGTKDDFSFSPNLETALTADDDEVVITYAEKSVSQTISVTVPTPVAKTVVIIAEYEIDNETKFYAMSTGLTNKACPAIEVTKDGANLVAASDEDKAAIQWLMTTTGNNVTFQDANDDYLHVSSKADLEFVEDEAIWSMTQDGNGNYLFASLEDRALMYQASPHVFKNYSTNNSNGYARISEIFEVAAEGTNILVVTPVVHEFSIDPDEDVAFGKVEQGDEIEAKSFEVTLTNIENATVTLGGTGAAAFSIGEVSSLDENGGTITVTPNTANIGNYSATITLHDVAEEAADKVINVTMNVVAPRDCDRTDDFSTVNSGTPSSYDVERNTTDGWHAVNTAVTTKDDVTYLMINGKTSASGVITSPEFNYGIKELSLSYYYPYKENNGVSFKIEIKQNGLVVKEKSIINATAVKEQIYDATFEDINVEGKYQIVITNLCPSNSTSNADRYAIGDLCWKKYGDPTIETVRPSLNEGKWGTICPKQNVINPTGASFFTLSYGEFNGEMLDKVFFDEIGANESLVAGKPYLFIANGDEIRGIKDGDEATQGENDYNGFHGVLADYELYVAEAYKYYIIYDNEIRLCGIGEFTILAERAYLEVSDIPGNSTTQPAPGRRRLVMNVNNGNQMPTAIEGVEVSEAPRKVIINGELYIIRGEKRYDVRGQLVK